MVTGKREYHSVGSIEKGLDEYGGWIVRIRLNVVNLKVVLYPGLQ